MDRLKESKFPLPGNVGSTASEIFPLTGLRFVAAFYVFLFHIQIRWPLVEHGVLANFLSQGAIGMSVFFILSGFVLTYVYGGADFDVRSYYLNRIGRIYPVYLVAALITVPWLWPLISHISTPATVAVAFLKLSVLVVTNFTLTQAWFPQLFDYWNDGGSWSISTEAFFYLLFPVLLVTLRKLSRKRLIAAWVIFYIFSILPALSFAVFENRPSPGVPIFYAMPVFRLPEFLCGICICIAWTKFQMRLKYPFAIVCLLLAILVACLSLIRPHLPIYTGYNFIAVPAISVAIMALAQRVAVFGAVLGSAPFRWLGRISYCFYSFQALVILSMISFHDQIVEVFPILQRNFLFAFCGFGLLIFLAGLGYHWIEEPARKHIRSLHIRRLSAATKEAERIATGP